MKLINYFFVILFILNTGNSIAQDKVINLTHKGLFNFSMTFPSDKFSPSSFKGDSKKSGYMLTYTAGGKKVTTIVLATSKLTKQKIMKSYNKGKIMPGFGISKKAKFKVSSYINQTDRGGIIVTASGNYYPYYIFSVGGTTYNFSTFHSPTHMISKGDAQVILKVFESRALKISGVELTMADWLTSWREDNRISRIQYKRHASEPEFPTPVFTETAMVYLDLSHFGSDKKAKFPFKLKVPQFSQKMKQGREMNIIYPHPFPGEGLIEQSDKLTFDEVKDRYLRNKIPGVKFKHFAHVEDSGFIFRSTDGYYYPCFFKEFGGLNYYFHLDQSYGKKLTFNQAWAMYSSFAYSYDVDAVLSSDQSNRVMDLIQLTWLGQYAFPLTLDVPIETIASDFATGRTSDASVTIGPESQDVIAIYRTVGIDAAGIKAKFKETREYQYSTMTVNESNGGIMSSKKFGYIPFYHISDGEFDYILHYPEYKTRPLTQEQAHNFYNYMKTVKVNGKTKKLAMHDTGSIKAKGPAHCAFYNTTTYNMDIWNPFNVDLPSNGVISGGDIRWNQYSAQIVQGDWVQGELAVELDKIKQNLAVNASFNSFVVEDSTGYIAKHIDGSYSAYYLHRINGQVYALKSGYSPFLYGRKEINVIYELLKSATYNDERPKSQK